MAGFIQWGGWCKSQEETWPTTLKYTKNTLYQNQQRGNNKERGPTEFFLERVNRKSKISHQSKCRRSGWFFYSERLAAKTLLSLAKDKQDEGEEAFFSTKYSLCLCRYNALKHGQIYGLQSWGFSSG